ncbi:MAG: Gfo/Idh/MocA family oxidoreductase [Saprospiraceae bacterium]|nr:Gfo/Idh/MocA family oxidoreductase [Saprospiraceae bacterium]
MGINRRKFIQSSALAGAGIALSTTNVKGETITSETKSPKSKVNIGVIGSGFRGQSHIDLLLNRSDCDVVAVADIDERMLARTKSIFDKKNKKQPVYFTDGPYAYRKMLEMESLDAVMIATPWRWHSIQCTDAMKAGIYVGTEVCGAFSVDECWQLVNTQEETGTHLFFLENVCYRRDVMAVMNMVKQGMFGRLLHLEGGYQHDLRAVKFNDGEKAYGGGVEFGEKAFHEAKWRTQHSVKRNGDLYPTHGVGPVAQMININRGNRFLYLTSMSSQALGLHDYIVNHENGGHTHPNANVEFKLGDVVTTMIKCANGESITLFHDTNLPRPYSLGFRVQGTGGIWMDVNKSLLLNGKTEEHRWTEAKDWLAKYDHPYWKENEQKAIGAGHGGMDWFLVDEFVNCVKENKRPPIDVYDAAAWLAITPLSEESIATGSSPISFPDFTRGKWIDD